MTRDFFNMFSVFFGVIAFCLVVVFTIGFLEVETGQSNAESAVLNNKLKPAGVSNAQTRNIPKAINQIDDSKGINGDEQERPKLE